MVLSMLPMNVFGQIGHVAANPQIPGAGTFQHGEGANGVQFHTVPLQFNIGSLSNADLNNVHLQVGLTGDLSSFYLDPAQTITHYVDEVRTLLVEYPVANPPVPVVTGADWSAWSVVNSGTTLPGDAPPALPTNVTAGNAVETTPGSGEAQLRQYRRDTRETLATIAVFEGANQQMTALSRTWFDAHIGPAATGVPVEVEVIRQWGRIGDAGSNRYRNLEIRLVFPNGANSSVPSDVTGNVQIRFPVRMTNNAYGTRPNVDMFARMDYEIVGTSQNIFELGNTRLNPTVAAADLGIARAVDYTNFATDIVALPGIRLSENQFGNFGRSLNNFNRATNDDAPPSNPAVTNWTTVRLEAPLGYDWHVTTGFRPTFGLVDYNTRWGGARTITEAMVEMYGPITEFVNGVRQQVLYLRLNTPEAWSVGARLPRQLDIRNLHLVSTTDNARLGGVDINVSTLYQLPRNLETTAGAVPRVNRPESPRPMFRTESLRVGNRVAPGLTAERVQDEPIAIRTGFTNFSVPATPVPMWGHNNRPIQLVDGTQGNRGVQTATIRIYENAPGAWGNIIGDALDFTFEQDGVDIIGAAARLGRTGADYPARNMFPGSNDYRWEGDFMPWGEDLIEAARRSTTHTLLTPGRFRVTVPQIPGDDIAQQQARRLRYIRSLEVTFWISVTGGFEVNNPGETVDVTISGPGAAGIPAAQRVIPVALPVDPVSLYLPDGPVEFQTDVLSTVSNHSISDIEVTIYEPHNLVEGNVIVVRVGGIQASDRAFGLHAFASNVSHDAVGLVLGNVVRPPAENISATAGSTFLIPIQRVPNVGDNDGPITITFSGVTVSGTVVPNVEYYVIVHGNAIADNFYLGNRPGVGQFAIEPYFAYAGSYVEGILDNAPGQTGPQAPTREFFLTEGVPFGGVEEPLYWYIVGRNRVGMVSIRAFAYLVGGEDADFDWDSATRVGSVSSLNRHGEPVAISVTEGNPRANIRTGAGDQSVDMADYVRGLSGPTGSVYPINRGGRLYLPLRFVAELFGYRVERTGNVVRIF